MNRKEEMEALIEDSERYAKIIEGIQVAPDNWKDGDPTRREPRETLLKCAAALRASAGGGREEIGGVLAEIAAERLGQISKGYDAAHDDEHTEGSIATAAAVYALHPFGWHFVISERVKGRSRSRLLSLRDFWPWEWDQFKPGSERQRLVKSAAMLVAEIERMDRLSPSPSVGTGTQPISSAQSKIEAE